MSDSYRSRAQLVADFATNRTRAITPQLVRNFVYSTILVGANGAVDCHSLDLDFGSSGIIASYFQGDISNGTGLTPLHVGAIDRRFSTLASTGTDDTTKKKIGSLSTTNGVDFDVAGKGTRVKAVGTFGNNSHTKRIQVYHGNLGTSSDPLLLDTTVLSATGSGTWVLEVESFMVGFGVIPAGTFRAVAELRIQAAGMTTDPIISYTEDYSMTDARNQNYFSIYGTAGAGAVANDIKFTMAYGEFLY